MRKRYKLIEQKYIGDCTAACISMMTYSNYDEILPLFDIEIKQDFKDGTENARAIEIYYKITGKNLLIEDDIVNLEKPCILCVDSLNYEGHTHCIFWDGHKIFDPSIKKKYTELPSVIHYYFIEE